MKQERTKFREELESRVDFILDWYKNCVRCDETLKNARRDVNGIFDEVCDKFGLSDPPISLQTRFGDDDCITIDVVNKEL